jgi:hypothetical protein
MGENRQRVAATEVGDAFEQRSRAALRSRRAEAPGDTVGQIAPVRNLAIDEGEVGQGIAIDALDPFEFVNDLARIAPT